MHEGYDLYRLPFDDCQKLPGKTVKGVRDGNPNRPDDADAVLILVFTDGSELTVEAGTGETFTVSLSIPKGAAEK